MTVKLIYNDVVVDKSNSIDSLIEDCLSHFGLDFSQYRLSEMRQSGLSYFDSKTIEFLLKEEDYIKLRDNKINKILSE